LAWCSSPVRGHAIFVVHGMDFKNYEIRRSFFSFILPYEVVPERAFTFFSHSAGIFAFQKIPGITLVLVHPWQCH
jgi:hypothetical protein